MKKTSTLVLLIVLSLASCKKDYTCKCTDIGTPGRTFTIHDKEENAKKQCSETSYYTGSCELQ